MGGGGGGGGGQERKPLNFAIMRYFAKCSKL